MIKKEVVKGSTTSCYIARLEAYCRPGNDVSIAKIHHGACRMANGMHASRRDLDDWEKMTMVVDLLAFVAMVTKKLLCSAPTTTRQILIHSRRYRSPIFTAE